MPNNLGIDIYTKFDGIDGEATDSGHQKWSVVTAISHSIEQPTASTTVSGEVTSGQPKHGDFTMTLVMDSGLPKYHEYASTGKIVPSVKVDFMRATGDSKTKQLAVEMDNVVISSISLSTGGNDERPTETLACRYDSIKWTFTTSKGSTAAGYKVSEHKKI